MIQSHCATCGIPGTYLDFENQFEQANFEEIETLLVEINGNFYDFVCGAAADSVCIVCLERKVLYRDARCKNILWVCAQCINKQCVHRHKCYSDGCMTLEEFAAECQLVDLDEDTVNDDDGGDHWKYGEQ